MTREVSITINGEVHAARVDHRLLLVDFIREIAGATATHVGCGFEGRCGACTVVVEGVAVKSCLMLAVQADGQRVLTAEGLARDGRLHPLQEAFWNRHGLQCGFCTPGMLMTIYDFLKEPEASDEAIRLALAGVLCRCTGYVHIIEAVREAMERLAELPPTERAAWFPL